MAPSMEADINVCSTHHDMVSTTMCGTQNIAQKGGLKTPAAHTHCTEAAKAANAGKSRTTSCATVADPWVHQEHPFARRLYCYACRGPGGRAGCKSPTPMCSSRPPGLSASTLIIRPSSMLSFSAFIFCLQDRGKQGTKRTGSSKTHSLSAHSAGARESTQQPLFPIVLPMHEQLMHSAKTTSSSA